MTIEVTTEIRKPKHHKTEQFPNQSILENSENAGLNIEKDYIISDMPKAINLPV